MTEFKVIHVRYRNGNEKTRLISAAALMHAEDEEADEVEDFFERGIDIDEVTELGVVRVDGDIHLLADSYLED